LQVEHTATRGIFFVVTAFLDLHVLVLVAHTGGPHKRHHRRCLTEAFPQCPQYRRVGIAINASSEEDTCRVRSLRRA
jgi:hypothetical protein